MANAQQKKKKSKKGKGNQKHNTRIAKFQIEKTNNTKWNKR